MASTNGLQGAPSNLTNTIDGLVYLYANGQEITGLYINSQAPTSNVNSVIILDPAGKFEIQNSALAPIFTVDNTNITNMYEAFTNILTTANINADGNLNLNISNNTLTHVVGIKDADGIDLVRTGYFAFGGTFGNKAIQLNSCPLVIEAGITGTVLPETIVDPNWEQIRIFNSNVPNMFSSICCDGTGTYFITSDTLSNPATEKPNYAGRLNFSILPDQSTNFQGNLNSNGDLNAYSVSNFNGVINANSDLSVLGFSIFTGAVGFKNDVSWINPADVNVNLCELVLTNDYGVDTSKFTYFCGVNLATKWSDVHLPFSNIRMMNGNKDFDEMKFNSFLDIKVEGKYCYFYFSPTVTSYYVDPPTLEVMRFDNSGLVTIPNLNVGTLSSANLSLSGTLSVTGLTTLQDLTVNGTITAPLNLSSATANQFINLLGTGGAGSQSCLIKFQVVGSTGPSAQIGLTSGAQTVIVAPGVFVVTTNLITGLSQGITGLVNCAQGLAVTGQTATTTLSVSSTSVQTGITNTGNISNSGAVNTATLNVSGASTQTGIVNTGNVLNSGQVYTYTLQVTGASLQTGITNTGNIANTGNITNTGTFSNASTSVFNRSSTSAVGTPSIMEIYNSGASTPNLVLSTPDHLSTTVSAKLLFGLNNIANPSAVFTSSIFFGRQVFGSGPLNVLEFNSGTYKYASLSAGNLYLDSNGLLNSTSDARVKNNIKPEVSTNILERLSKVEVSRFNHNSDSYKDYTGFIAQNVEQIFPNVVDGKKHQYQIDHFDEKGEAVYKVDENGEKIIRPRGFDNTAMLGYTVLAVQELTKKVAQQQELIEKLLSMVGLK